MTEDDITKAKAEALVEQINAKAGLSAELFWDRGPFCARIPLTPNREEGAPTLYVFVEDSADYRFGPLGNGWRWRGQITGEGVSDDLTEVGFEFLERTWLGEDAGTVAARVRAVAQRLLTSGITSWA